MHGSESKRAYNEALDPSRLMAELTCGDWWPARHKRKRTCPWQEGGVGLSHSERFSQYQVDREARASTDQCAGRGKWLRKVEFRGGLRLSSSLETGTSRCLHGRRRRRREDSSLRVKGDRRD